MEEKDIVILEECPLCRGVGMVMHEGGWNVQVECCDCSAHTIYVEYNNDAEKAEADGGFCEYVVLRLEKDEDGEDTLVTVDDDDEFDIRTLEEDDI